MTGFVYAIQADDAVKIGWASDPVRRLSELNVGSPNKHRLIGFVAATKSQERELHLLLSRWRIRGEWFRLVDAVEHFAKLLPVPSPEYAPRPRHPWPSTSFRPANETEVRLSSMGASNWAIIKWRRRGIPPKWELKLLEALGHAPRMRTNEPSHRRGRPPNTMAAE
jgi:hypothetical protein